MVSSNTIEFEALEKFFIILARGAAEAAKKLPSKVANNPTRALDLAADLSNAAANNKKS